ncbi:MAG: hypothetical protein HDT40_04115 [Lachnospiraceae bacterium]|nr:hypothetical protein [Lachnospiraceae bacterium]
MSNENDVIVFDEEYVYASMLIKKYGDELIKMIKAYSRCVDIILDEAIKDEKISSALREIRIQVKSVIRDIRITCDEASKACTDYIIEIENADDFLYKGGLNIWLNCLR